jgi:hypothetical protein
MNPSNDDLDLLRRLRQLPRERDPANDLWAGIAARIDAPNAVAIKQRPRRWGLIGLAMAASTLLAAVLVQRALPPIDEDSIEVPSIANQAAPGDEFVRRQAEAITIEYQLALESLPAAPMSPDFENAALELDSSAQQIRSALKAEPDAVYLLDRLRHTYEQRLKLTQRALVG